VVLAEKISGELHCVAANGTRMEFFLIVQILTLKRALLGAQSWVEIWGQAR